MLSIIIGDDISYNLVIISNLENTKPIRVSPLYKEPTGYPSRYDLTQSLNPYNLNRLLTLTPESNRGTRAHGKPNGVFFIVRRVSNKFTWCKSRSPNNPNYI